jgi:hypothetical protein
MSSLSSAIHPNEPTSQLSACKTGPVCVNERPRSCRTRARPWRGSRRHLFRQVRRALLLLAALTQPTGSSGRLAGMAEGPSEEETLLPCSPFHLSVLPVEGKLARVGRRAPMALLLRRAAHRHAAATPALLQSRVALRATARASWPSLLQGTKLARQPQAACNPPRQQPHQQQVRVS